MAVNYLHGVETIEVKSGTINIQVIKSAVITVVGIAPLGPKNTPILIQSEEDAAQFGSKLPGFTIPQALDAIFQQDPATVVVVNIFDDVDHTTQVTQEPHTVTDGRLKLTYAPIGTVTVLDQNGEPTDYVLNTDYAIDAFGNFVVTSAAIAEGEQLKFSYKRYDATKVADADLIGAIDVDGNRTGFTCLDLVYPTYGFSPKIITSPGFSTRAAISAEMLVRANKYRAISLVDAPAGATPSGVIAGRGPGGTVPGFNTSSDRVYLLYPMLTVYDEATDSNINVPYSQYMAGVIARTDRQDGYWVSPSNHEIFGVLGLERFITAAINDPSTEANTLNENGITTVFNAFGSGFRTWGNRSAAWPSTSTPENFLCIRRVADIVDESIEVNMLPFIDLPINQAVIDSIRESVNSFIRTQIARGALIDGECKFIRANNPNSELALGHLRFDVSLMPPPPAERISFYRFIDISLLKTIV